jgi:hypothetical protein
VPLPLAQIAHGVGEDGLRGAQAAGFGQRDDVLRIRRGLDAGEGAALVAWPWDDDHVGECIQRRQLPDGDDGRRLHVAAPRADGAEARRVGEANRTPPDDGVRCDRRLHRPAQVVEVGGRQSDACRRASQPRQVAAESHDGSLPEGDRLEHPVAHGDAVIEDRDPGGRFGDHGTVHVGEHRARA